MVGIDNLDIGVGLNVGGSDGTGFAGPDLKGDRLALLRDHQNLLQVKNDVSDIFDHTIDRLELVINAIDFDGGNRSSFD